MHPVPDRDQSRSCLFDCLPACMRACWFVHPLFHLFLLISWLVVCTECYSHCFFFFFLFLVVRFLLGWLVFVLVLFADLVYVINTNAYDPRYAKKKEPQTKNTSLQEMHASSLVNFVRAQKCRSFVPIE